MNGMTLVKTRTALSTPRFLVSSSSTRSVVAFGAALARSWLLLSLFLLGAPHSSHSLPSGSLSRTVLNKRFERYLTRVKTLVGLRSTARWTARVGSKRTVSDGLSNKVQYCVVV